MSNLYHPEAVTGTEFTRAYQVIIDNRTDRPAPVVSFFEERAQLLDSGRSRRAEILGQLQVAFDPDGEIPILNPLTGEDTGEVTTHAEIQALLYSAYIAAATARDTAADAMLDQPTEA